MSDEVSQFLESVERLRGQQIEEDEVRARELEEYLAAKRERQARREGEFSHPLLFRRALAAVVISCHGMSAQFRSCRLMASPSAATDNCHAPVRSWPSDS